MIYITNCGFFHNLRVNFRFLFLEIMVFVATCRFASKHLDNENKNIQNDELVQKWEGKKTVLNVLPKKVQVCAKNFLRYDKVSPVYSLVFYFMPRTRDPLETSQKIQTLLQLNFLTLEWLLPLIFPF